MIYDNLEKVPDPEKKEHFSVQKFTESQAEASPERLNEDAAVVLENERILVVAVIDGATATSAVTEIGSKPSAAGGRFAAQTIIEGIKESFDAAVSARELLLDANQKIADKLLEQGVDAQSVSSLELSRASGCLVRIDKTREEIEISQAGDTACLIVNQDGHISLALPLDSDIYDEKTILLAQKISADQGISLSEAFKCFEISELMNASQNANNDPNGQGNGVLNGSKNLKQYIQTKTWSSLKDVRRIILLTDGLYLPTEEFNAEPNWSEIAELIKAAGLKGLYQEVLTLKNADPELKKYPRFKKHDDATGVVIDIM